MPHHGRVFFLGLQSTAGWQGTFDHGQNESYQPIVVSQPVLGLQRAVDYGSARQRYSNLSWESVYSTTFKKIHNITPLDGI